MRELERQLGKALRKVAVRVAAGGATTPITVDADDLARARSGGERFHAEEVAERTAVPGVATGPAPSPAPAATCCSSRRRPTTANRAWPVTGQLGDVMKESAQIALVVGAGPLAIGPRPVRGALKPRFHVHFPAGAVPKDGPLGRHHR